MKLVNLLILCAILLVPSSGAAREEPAPDMELLEFVGSFETVRGKTVDPLDLADNAAGNHRKEHPDAAGKEKKRPVKPGKQGQKDRNDEK